jgi:acyl-CoA synthetase (NDP forming)
MTAPSPFADVTGMLNPETVAVVGASDQERSLGGAAVRFLDKFGYPGVVWPVHPSAETVLGLPAFSSVAKLPGVPDLVILAIAAARIPAAVQECAEAGIKNIIVWAGGFSEGGPEGVALQDEVVRICSAAGISLLGPNCIGLINTALPLTASFASFMRDVDSLPTGNISMIGQSGGLVTMAMAHASAAGFGFRYAISTGNEAVLTAADFIAACVDDARTEVIALYIEGTKNGPKFIAALEKARAAGKPVVLLRGGSSVAAARAAAAHTGALAGESRVWSAVLQEFGVIETHSLEELLDVVQQISSAPARRSAKGPGVALVTFGGGSGVLAADQCEARGLTTPPLSPDTQNRLKPLVPSIASTQNPIDLTPQVYSDPQWLAKLPEALDVIAADPGIDSILLQFGPMAVGALDIAQVAKDFIERAPVPVLLAWPLSPKGTPQWLRERGLNVFLEYDRAIRVLSHFVASSRTLPTTSAVSRDFAWDDHIRDPESGLVLSEHNAHRLLASAGLPVAEGRLARDTAEAITAAREIGWPVVVKGMSDEVTHKFAAGLVKLGVDSDESATAAATALFDRGRELGVELDGVYVQHMVAGGTEILVSALRDPVFGVIVSCGAGGVLTEIIDDVVLHRAPVSRETATDMLRGLRIIRKLTDREDVDLTPIAAFVESFSELAASAPYEKFVIEVNPVKFTTDEAVAVDGLLIIEEP